MRLLRRVSGAVALALFAAMAVILLTRFPSDALMPQTQLVPYLDIAFADFALLLQQDKLAGLYRFVLLYMDSGFIACFALWAMLCLSARPGAFIGFALVASCVALDLSENMMILGRSGLSGHGILPVEAFVAGISPVYFLTLAKYGAFLVTLLMVALPWMFEKLAKGSDA